MAHKEMTLEQAMLHVCEDSGNVKCFSNKEAADVYSESLKHLWFEGKGQVTGPFINSKSPVKKSWDVQYK